MNRYSLNSKAASRRLSSQSGFTLIEILLVAAGIVLFMGLILQLGPGVMIKFNVAHDAGQLAQVKTLATSYLTEERSFGRIPLTEGATGIPASATAGGNMTALAAAARFDDVLVGEGLLDKVMRSALSPNVATSGSIPVRWDSVNQRFDATAAPDMDYSSASRFECRVSTGTGTLSAPAAGPVPSAAAGGNFRLDGVNGLVGNVRVLYRVLPAVHLPAALALSQKLDGTDLSQTDATTTDDRGSVVYAVTAGSDTTTVYVYVAQY